MTGSPALVRRILTTTLLLVIGLLILQSLGYGIGFFLDPASGLGEFASPPPPSGDELTVALVGMVGVGMLGTAAMLGLAAVLILKANPAGAYIAMVIGGVYLLAGWSALRASWVWDASFYAASGVVLLGLAVVVRWAQADASEAEGAPPTG